jgi:ABC-2 type transport system permease protein
MIEQSTLPGDQQLDAVASSTTLRSRATNRPLAWRGAGALAWREIIRFLRQRNRVIGAIGQPLVFWLLFGVGMNQNFQLPGQGFRLYFVPGTIVLVLLFTAIFATISIIEDRQEGFLQAVLVAPLPRWSVVLGKVIGGSVLAVGQGLIFLGLTLTLGVTLSAVSAAGVFLLMSLTAVGLTSLGLCLAWRLDSTQGFHALMNLLLMPMWLLSGAFFPVPRLTDQTTWGETALHVAMRCNPVTYAVAGLRQLLFGSADYSSGSTSDGLWLPSLMACWWVTMGFSFVMLWLAARVARRPAQGDLR